MASENEPMTETTEDDAKAASDSTLYVQVEDSLQTPLDHVIARFETRYPHVQVLASYVPSTALLTLPEGNTNGMSVINNTDIIIADDGLSVEQLSPLQTQIDVEQGKHNQRKAKTDSAAQDNSDSMKANKVAVTDNTEARRLNSFSYAIKDTQKVDGVILTNNPAAISFRNFLLSSTGQDILRKYDYYNIDGYNNTVNDLFKPTSNPQASANGSAVEVADALTNGK
jgi:ABC-type molybdate transport system substrate-binding protein